MVTVWSCWVMCLQHSRPCPTVAALYTSFPACHWPISPPLLCIWPLSKGLPCPQNPNLARLLICFTSATLPQDLCPGWCQQGRLITASLSPSIRSQGCPSRTPESNPVFLILCSHSLWRYIGSLIC